MELLHKYKRKIFQFMTLFFFFVLFISPHDCVVRQEEEDFFQVNVFFYYLRLLKILWLNQIETIKQQMDEKGNVRQDSLGKF